MWIRKRWHLRQSWFVNSLKRATVAFLGASGTQMTFTLKIAQFFSLDASKASCLKLCLKILFVKSLEEWNDNVLLGLWDTKALFFASRRLATKSRSNCQERRSAKKCQIIPNLILPSYEFNTYFVIGLLQLELKIVQRLNFSDMLFQLSQITLLNFRTKILKLSKINALYSHNRTLPSYKRTMFVLCCGIIVNRIKNNSIVDFFLNSSLATYHKSRHLIQERNSKIVKI